VAADRTRRAVLAAGAVCLPMLAVSGCKGVGALAAPPRPAPDVAILRAAIAAEELMIARYDAVVRGSDGLATALRPLRAEHRAHLAQLRSRLIVPPAAASRSATASASRSAASGDRPAAASGDRPAAATASRPSAYPSAAAPALDAASGPGSGDTGSASAGSGEAGNVPAGRAEAISFLQDAERAAAAALLRKLPAVSPSLAQLMASVAASEATHVAALATASGTG
jgi:hypothetical protein